MKKSLRILIPLALLLMLFALALPTQADTLVEHTHNFAQSVITKQPTCTESGVKTSYCNCGERKTESIPALGHSWSAWKTTKAATCTAAGTQSRTCSRCGKTETKTIPAGHKWSAWKIVKKATCGEDGTSRRTCSVCKKTDTITIKATGKHKYGSWKVITPATCTEKGLRERVCSVCGQKQKQQIKALGGKHQWSDWKVTQAATCTEAGEESRSCSRCKDVQTRAIDPLGHEWDHGVTTVPAGYLETGVKTYTCARCGATKTEEVPVNVPMNGSSIMDQLRNLPPDAGHQDELRIVTQPVGGAIDHDGGSLTLSVEAAGGTPPYTYQWRGMSSVTDWPFWFNAENGTDSTLEAQKGNRRYYCQVYDAKGNHVDSARVLVTYNLYISQQPENTSTSEMDPVILTCKAAGGVPFTDAPDTYYYTWYDIDGNPVGYGSAFEVPGVGEHHLPKTGQYLCEVEDAAGNTVTSKAAIVYDADPFEAKTDTEVVELLDGQDYELWAEAYGGIGPYTGVWLRDGQEIPTQPGNDGEFTASITGDGSKEVVYTFLATDAMDDAASCTVKVRYPQLSIARQPQSGMIDEGKYTLGIVMADGEEPFTFTLYRNGEKVDSYSNQRNFFYHDVTESGQYYYHAEDATGRWADSITVTVQDPVFRIDLLDVAYITSKDGTTLHAVPKNGVEPYRYSWWFMDPTDGHAEPMSYGDTATDTFIARYAGTYVCYAEDATKACDRKEVLVYSFLGEPIITGQPRSVILDTDADRDQYVHSFICEAIAYDGTKDTLEYRWEQKTPSGWQDVHSMGHNAYTWTGYMSKGTADGGIFRCVVTDTRNGEETVSDEASVATKLTVEVVSGKRITNSSGQVIYSVYGGIAPYRVRGYAHRLYGIYDMDTIFVYSLWDIKTDELCFMDTLEWDETFDQAPKKRYSGAYHITNALITYSKSEPTELYESAIDAKCYLVVTDASGQRCETPVYFESD